MGQGVTIFVVLSCESLDVVVARLDRALLRTLVLVSEHVRLQIFEDLSTIRIRTPALLFRLLAAEVAILTATGGL